MFFFLMKANLDLGTAHANLWILIQAWKTSVFWSFIIVRCFSKGVNMLQYRRGPLGGAAHQHCAFNPTCGCCSVFCASKLGRLGEPVVQHLAAKLLYWDTGV